MLIDATPSAASSANDLFLTKSPCVFDLDLAYLTWVSLRSLNYQRWYENAAE
jgi:hypothetical protein